MKKLIGAALALFASATFGATLVPIQLLNPTGSSSGQAIVSTGASSAPAWGGIGLNGIASIAANTVLANATASSAAPTAFAMPSCSTSASALNWTTSTGFTCNTAVNAAQLGGQTFTSPTITTPNIVGTATNNNATAGSVGEFVTATGTAVSLTTGTPANCTSLSNLPAGDYDVWGTAIFNAAGSTIFQNGNVAINTTSATFPAAPFQAPLTGLTFSAGASVTLQAPTVRESLSGTTTVFLVVQSAFTTSTETATCFISARRRR